MSSIREVLRIKELRLAHDPPLTQEALAFRARVSVRTVSRAEQGTGFPSKRSLKAIARALGVSLADLLVEAA